MNNLEESRLEQRNIRPTAVRVLVLRYLLEKGTSTSLVDLEQHFELSDKSTLFRTLKTFQEKGLVHTIDDGTGILKYAMCFEDCECALQDQHMHFHCVKCKDTFCLPNSGLPTVSLPKHFSIQQVNFVVKGRCSNCYL